MSRSFISAIQVDCIVKLMNPVVYKMVQVIRCDMRRLLSQLSLNRSTNHCAVIINHLLVVSAWPTTLIYLFLKCLFLYFALFWSVSSIVYTQMKQYCKISHTSWLITATKINYTRCLTKCSLPGPATWCGWRNCLHKRRDDDATCHTPIPWEKMINGDQHMCVVHW